MGFWKRWQQEQEDQGWSYSDKTICSKCVKEPYLQSLVRDALAHQSCDFCSNRRPSRGAPFNVLMKAVASTFFQYYCRAVNELGSDSEDKDYFGATYDTWDLVHDEFSDVSDNEDVLKEIIDCLGDETWCDQNPYGYSGAERYNVSWSAFCRTVKHKTRYFFTVPPEVDDRFGSDNELTPVPEVLSEIAGIIETASLDKTLPPDTSLFRIRPHHPTIVCNDCGSLGPPPQEKATNNRMSPAGVSVFYAAFDFDTARAEVSAGLRARSREILTGAEWRPTRQINVLSLERLPPLGSVYAQDREERAPFVFLKQFVDEITCPVVHDGKEHIEYVPTQILTEYLRLFYKHTGTTRLDGISYPSVQRKGGRSIVLFASNDSLNPDGPFPPSDPMVRLVEGSIRRFRIRRPRRNRNARRP